jgi:hypothetical protein
MAQYVSGRQPFLNVGIPGITTDSSTLNVVGKVGIGTTNASQNLDVYGAIRSNGIFMNSSVISENFNIPPYNNAFVFGPISIIPGKEISVSPNSTFSIQ